MFSRRNAQDSLGYTALHLAAQYSFHDVISALLLAGANTRVKTRAGQTALNVAEQLNDDVTVTVIRDADRLRVEGRVGSWRDSVSLGWGSLGRGGKKKDRDASGSKPRMSRVVSLLCGLNKV